MRAFASLALVLLALLSGDAAQGAERDDRFVSIPLHSVCNRGLAFDDPSVPAGRRIGWTGVGDEDLSQFPTGRFTYNDIPFAIIDPADNRGRSAILLHGAQMPRNPKRVDIPIGRSFRRLHVLHTCLWCNGIPGHYRIIFKGGAVQTVTIEQRYNINDWYVPQDMPGALLAWYGKQRSGPTGLGVYLCSIEVERRLPIERLELVSTGTGGVIAVLAITGER